MTSFKVCAMAAWPVYSSSVIRSLAAMWNDGEFLRGNWLQIAGLRAPWMAAALALLVGVAVQVHAGPSGMMDSELLIVSANGEHRFEIEVARTPEEQARGLMYRQSLAPTAGMLFTYTNARNVAMWMRNTYIPLDMIFIGADWRITRIAERTIPLSLVTVASEGPVVAVLEVNAGTASRLGLRPGDRVVYNGPGARNSR